MDGLKPLGKGTHMDVPDFLLGQHSPGLQGFPLRLLCRDGGTGQVPTELMELPGQVRAQGASYMTKTPVEGKQALA